LSKTELDEIVRQYDDKSRHLGLVEVLGPEGHKHYLNWLYKDWLRVPSAPASQPRRFADLEAHPQSGFAESQGS